jgi:hypothetical protein
MSSSTSNEVYENTGAKKGDVQEGDTLPTALSFDLLAEQHIGTRTTLESNKGPLPVCFIFYIPCHLSVALCQFIPLPPSNKTGFL